MRLRRSGHQADEFVALAWKQEVIVGIGRLCVDAGNLCLRGMQVQAEHRRTGIGSMVLNRLSTQIGSAACYCLPYSHLVGFYAHVGFEPVSATLPGGLDERLRGYLRRGLAVAAMLRPAIR
jgi:predicted N-acetyltransferase YhbS